ncbi:MAG: hypothetical protein K2G36_07615 [Ruminococcus sp.]|nr:hypothetical protein [Ruminococcus sp.]
MYNDIKLEKGLYNLSEKSFTNALEELDPTSAYCGTPMEKLDAFERQLKRFNIRVAGQSCDRVEKFFSSTETAVLFPEFATRCIRKGFEETILSSVCATQTVCGSSQYLGCIMDDSAEYTTFSQSDALSETVVRESSSAIRLSKYGRIINASYETVRQQKLDIFGVVLRSIGVKLALSIVKDAVSVLETGADVISVPALTYSSLARLYGSFDCFNMNAIITSPEIASEILAMEQLSDISVDADGKLILPFGAELIKTAAIGENTIIGIDKNFALEFITSSDLVLETDKLIDRQLDQIVASITCGFRKITPDAVKILKVTK